MAKKNFLQHEGKARGKKLTKADVLRESREMYSLFPGNNAAHSSFTKEDGTGVLGASFKDNLARSIAGL